MVVICLIVAIITTGILAYRNMSVANVDQTTQWDFIFIMLVLGGFPVILTKLQLVINCK